MRSNWNPYRRSPVLGESEEQSLVAAMSVGDKAARERLITAHLRLVVKIAKKYAGRGVDIGDLIAEGTHGLIRGVDRFDSSKCARVSGYVRHWITKAIRLCLARNHVVHVPAQMWKLIRERYRIQHALTEATGLVPSDSEVASVMGLSAAQYRNLSLAIRGCTVRLLPLNDYSELDCDFVAPESPELAQLECRDLVESLGRSLTRRELTVLTLRYGFDGQGSKTYPAIASQMGLCRRTVQRIDHEARRKLRAGVYAEGV